MKDFNIVVDSAADLPIEIIKKYDLTLLGLTCNFKRKEYIEDENSSLSYKEFYQGIRDGEMPTTSQVNSQQFFDAFEKIVDELEILKPAGKAVTSIEEGIQVAESIGYPVLVRPSYVLGGRAMQIVGNKKALEK